MGFAQDTKKETVLIVGRGYGNILTAARSFGVVGYGVEVLRVFRSALGKKSVLNSMHPESSSRYVERYAQCVAVNESDLVEAILSFSVSDGKKLLFPVDDFSAYVIDQNSEKFVDFFYLTGFRGEGSLAYYAQKHIQKELAKSCGLTVIPGGVISLEGRGECCGDFFGYPCFVKPNVSAFSSKSRIAKCEHVEDLQRVLSRYSSHGEPEVLVEDCVDVSEEYSFLGVSTGENAVVYGVVRAVAGGHDARRGITSMGELLPVDSFQEIAHKCCCLMVGVGYVGVFDVDFLEDPNGKFFFTEANFRPGASTYSTMLLGSNLPAVLADYVFHGVALKESSNSCPRDNAFVNEKVLLEEYIFGSITAAERNHLAKASGFSFLKNAVDPAPYRLFRFYWHGAFLFRVRNKILRARRALSAHLDGIWHFCLSSL